MRWRLLVLTAMLLMSGTICSPLKALTFTRWGDLNQITVLGIALSAEYYQEDYEGMGMLAKSFLTSQLTVHTLKVGINARRPNGGDYSFPSGHTSAATVGLGHIAKRYGFIYAIPLVIFPLSVGASRVLGNFHHTRDVLAGAAISLASDWYFTDAKTKTLAKEYQYIPKPLLTGPDPYTPSIGLNWNISFN